MSQLGNIGKRFLDRQFCRSLHVLQLKLVPLENEFPIWKLFKRTKKTAVDAGHPRLHRLPVRVYYPGEEIPGSRKRVKPKPTIAEEERKSAGLSSIPAPADKSADLFTKLMSEIVRNPNRKKVALEGVRLVEEAFKAGLRPENLFLLKSMKEVPSAITNFVDDSGTELIRVTQKQMETWSSVTTPPGIIGIFKKPNPEDFKYRTRASAEMNTVPLTLICDNLREPGNLGSILRSAAAVGCKAILLSKGCADPWDMKVLRGGSGAHFQIPIYTDIHLSNMGSFIEFQESAFKINANDDVGVDEKNMKKSFKSTGVFLADSHVENPRSTLPLFSYADVDYRQFDEIYLVIGGETEGLSRTSLQITNSLEEGKLGIGMKRTVARIRIPLQSCVESLNVANAFGIIAFEIRRQFQNLNSTKTF